MKYFITDFRVRLKCTSQFPQFMLVNHLHHPLLATGRGNFPQHCLFRLTSCGNQPPNPFGWTSSLSLFSSCFSAVKNGLPSFFWIIFFCFMWHKAIFNLNFHSGSLDDGWIHDWLWLKTYKSHHWTEAISKL